MSLATTIYKLRTGAKFSQEKFASMLGVSRQAVQKWESGSAQPDLGNLITIARQFDVSLDALVLDSDLRIAEELTGDRKLHPEYAAMHRWEVYSSDLMTEYKQSMEEGLDIERYHDLFSAVDKMPAGELKERMADCLFDIVMSVPQRADYPYDEPSDLSDIRALRKPYEFERKPIDAALMRDKIAGAWLGRVCGCMLGKTVEGIRTDELHPFLKATGNFPMHRYITSEDATEERCVGMKYRLPARCFADKISYMPADDDTNYTVLGNRIVEDSSRDFTPADVMNAWQRYQPKTAYCTAERVAYRNYNLGYLPPDSAEYKNPYREWIGAQIRGDYFGYINPGNPELAAEMAWRDASISHIKNGIYGEMFIAAMLACAAVTDNLEDIIRGGLAQIPETSRLYESVTKLLDDFAAGMTKEACFANIHKDWDEHNQHDWCHTISNALIVVASLLYGDRDYGKAICMSVETGFDTDCNGATVGSILGMRGGKSIIGDEWAAPIHGLVQTSIQGENISDIEAFVERTMKHVVF